MLLFFEIWGFVCFIVHGTVVAVVDLFIMYFRAGCVWRNVWKQTEDEKMNRLVVQLSSHSPSHSTVNSSQLSLVINHNLIDKALWEGLHSGDAHPVAIVTGVSDGGIGFYTAMNLLLCGYSVHGVCRTSHSANDSDRKMRGAIDRQIHLNSGLASVVGNYIVHVCNMSDTTAVFRLSNTLAKISSLRVVVCNAGPMATPPRLSPQHLEEQFATHCVGHSLLLLRLVESRLLLNSSTIKTSYFRVVVVSSAAAAISTAGMQCKLGYGIQVHNDKSSFVSTFNRFLGYSDAKMLSLLFSMALSRFFERHRELAPYCTVNIVHPGPIRSRVIPNSGLPLQFFIDSDLSAICRLSPAIAALYVADVAASVRSSKTNGHFFRMGIDQTLWYEKELGRSDNREGMLRNSLCFPGIPAPSVSMDADKQNAVWKALINYFSEHSMIASHLFSSL